MNFPDISAEISFLKDVKAHYSVNAEAIQKKPSFRSADRDAFLAYQGLADAAQDVIDLLNYRKD